MTRFFLRSLFVLLLFVFIGCPSENSGQEEPPGIPEREETSSVRDVAQGLVEARITPTMGIGIRVQLIGSSHDLQSINEEEMTRILGIVQSAIQKYGFSLKEEDDNTEARHAICAAICAGLGRDAVKDVHLYGFTLIDFRPMPGQAP